MECGSVKRRSVAPWLPRFMRPGEREDTPHTIHPCFARKSSVRKMPSTLCDATIEIRFVDLFSEIGDDGDVALGQRRVPMPSLKQRTK